MIRCFHVGGIACQAEAEGVLEEPDLSTPSSRDLAQQSMRICGSPRDHIGSGAATWGSFCSGCAAPGCG